MENNPIMSAPEPQIMSFFDRMINVFTSPAELYTSVAHSPVQNSSWALPFLIALIISLISTYAILSDQTLRYQALEPQIQAMQERVERGDMTQEQMDRASEMIGSSSLILITGMIMSIVYTTISLFMGTFLFWITGKFFLKSPVDYKKMLEVYGLSMLIGIAGSVITLLMIFAMGSVLASPGGSLLILNSFDKNNITHILLISLNIMTIWQMVVIGVGLAKTAGKSNTTGIVVSLSLWLIFWVIVPNLIGRGMLV